MVVVDRQSGVECSGLAGFSSASNPIRDESDVKQENRGRFTKFCAQLEGVKLPVLPVDN